MSVQRSKLQLVGAAAMFIASKYEEIYMGGEYFIQFRLAHVLTTIYITFTFSSGLPLLYLLAFINLVAVYWMDKFMILRVY